MALTISRRRFVFRPTRCSPLRQSQSLEIMIDLPIGFPINNIISLLLLSGPISSTGKMWSRREKMSPWLLKTVFFSLATNPVLSPEFMMDTSLLIVAQLDLVMINVPSASKLAPSLTFERLVCHQDVF